MKKYIVFIITLIIILFVGIISFLKIFIIDNNQKEISEEKNNLKTTEIEVIDNDEEKHYLHISEDAKNPPEQDKCFETQSKSLEGLSETEITFIKNEVARIHTHIENELVQSVRKYIDLKNKESIYWNDFTSYDIWENPENGVKVDNGGRFLKVYDSTKKIKEIIKDEQTKRDLDNMLTLLKEGMDEHDVEKCFEAHKTIHDYDYWVFNTPPSDFKVEPADWGGIKVYFGKVSNIQDESVLQEETIQGFVETNNKRFGYIYISNYKRTKELGNYEGGIPVEGYTSANINNKNQICIDSITGKEYDTSYIQSGDILICKGVWRDEFRTDFDTRNNPITVIKNNNKTK